MACKGDLFYYLENPGGDNLWQAVKCWTTMPGPVTDATVALIMFGTLGIMYYIHDESVVTPLVLSIMLGGILVAALPASAANVAVIVLILSVSAGVMYVIHRARPRTQ